MNCNKPFCLMMYNGHKSLLAEVAEAKAKKDMFEKNFNMLFSEAQKNGTVSSRTGDLVMPTGDRRRVDTRAVHGANENV